MKISLLKAGSAILCVFFSSFLTAAPQAQERPFFKTYVELLLRTPPKVKLVSSPGVKSGTRINTNHNWGLIQVSYYPVFGRPDSKKTSNKRSGLWLDDVTMAVETVIVNSTGATKKQKSEGIALLTGRCDFWSVCLDRKEHIACLFIPPQLLDRYMPPSRSDGTVAKIAVPADFKVRVIFHHKHYGVVGEAYWGLRSRELRAQAREFRLYKESITSRNTLRGALLNRSRTPWSVNKVDSNDLLKPEIVLPDIDDAAIDKAADEAEEKAKKERLSEKKTQKKKQNIR